MRSTLKGTQRAYFIYPIRPGILEATAYFAQAAKEAAIDGLVNMSQVSAREDSKSHAAAHHWLSDRVFDWSGLTVVHIRPTFFAEWLLQLAPQIREGELHVPFGTGRHAPITDEDQGRVIAGILEDPAKHKGKIYPLFGPVEYTYREMAQVLSTVLGKKIEYEQVSFETFTEFRKGGAPKPGAPSRPGHPPTISSGRRSGRPGILSSSSIFVRSRSITRTGFSRAPTITSRNSAAVRP